MRVPYSSSMPSGSVTRRIFGAPSGSAYSASAAGAPTWVRKIVRVTQIFFGAVSHSFTHGVVMNCSCGGAAACAGGAGGAGGGFGAVLGAGFGLVGGACASAAATNAIADKAASAVTSARRAPWQESIAIEA